MRVSTLTTLTSLLVLTGAKKPPHATRPDVGNPHGVIPVTEVGCWQEKLELDAIQKAMHNLVEWGKNHKIREGTMYGEEYHDAGVWICNCKHFQDDHIVAAELEEALDIVRESCAHSSSGWVWSKKWQKAINFGSPVKMKNPRSDSDKCPRFCVWED